MWVPGETDGTSLGEGDGSVEGLRVGISGMVATEGLSDGSDDGISVRTKTVGPSEGSALGRPVGTVEGVPVSGAVGGAKSIVGPSVWTDGEEEGELVTKSRTMRGTV